MAPAPLIEAVEIGGIFYFIIPSSSVKEHGLVGVAFFTQSGVVDNICYRVPHGLVKLPPSSCSDNILVPGLPPLAPIDMLSFIYGQPKVLFDMVMNQYENVDKADWVLCNTFYKLNEEKRILSIKCGSVWLLLHCSTGRSSILLGGDMLEILKLFMEIIRVFQTQWDF